MLMMLPGKGLAADAHDAPWFWRLGKGLAADAHDAPWFSAAWKGLGS